MSFAAPLSAKRWERFLTVATPTLMLGAAGLASLASGGGQRYFGYMLAGASFFVLAGLAIGLVTLLAPRWLRPLLLAGTLLLSLDIAFGWVQLVYLFMRTWAPGAQLARQVLVLFFAFSGPLALVYLLRSRARPALLAASLALVISSLFLPAGAVAQIKPLINADRPSGPLGRVIIHILLDAHIGPAGIPDSVPGGRQMKQQIADFYQSHGFRIYSSAYTPYHSTELSVPAFLDLDDPAPTDITPEQLASRWDRPFSWFQQLHREGYSTYAYTLGGALDLCPDVSRASFADCERYGAGGLDLELWKDSPFRRMLVYIGRRSLIVQRLCALEPGCNAAYWIDLGRNLQSVRVLNRVVEAINVASGDTAIFAHIDLPHSPQLLGSDCRPNLPFPAVDAAPDLFFRRYFDQISCTQLYIDKIEKALAGRNALQNATIIVHGDHGIGPYQAGIDNDAWRTTWHSTLFAIKGPGIQPGLDNGFYRAQALLKSVATGEPPAPGDGLIWDRNLAGEPTIARLDRAQLAPPH